MLISLMALSPQRKLHSGLSGQIKLAIYGLLSLALTVNQSSPPEAKKVAFSLDIFRVEKKSKTDLNDWQQVFSDVNITRFFTRLVTGEYPGATSPSMAIVEGKIAGSKAFMAALSKKANVSVVTRQTFTTTSGAVVPFQTFMQEGNQPTTGVNLTILPYILPEADKIKLQVSVNVFDSAPEKTAMFQQVKIKSGQTLVLSERREDDTLLLVMTTPTRLR
ncbi:hypothetical protein [Candidatus Regiella endosymbiont of Tuberolachnus salignus]|uniref:hypothetical protein n=1 Tax=Candidatus Regiella endosymbiont of Tuberolachnus salignus TaxID=3077956 RepID=UPI0030CAD53C